MYITERKSKPKTFFLQYPTITVCPNGGMSATSWDYTADVLDLLDPSDVDNQKLFRLFPEALFSVRKNVNREVIRYVQKVRNYIFKVFAMFPL